jgi:hypothetical protein
MAGSAIQYRAKFFDALKKSISGLLKEDLDTKLNIQEALVLMIEAFRNCSSNERKTLLNMLFKYIENVRLSVEWLEILSSFVCFLNF